MSKQAAGTRRGELIKLAFFFIFRQYAQEVLRGPARREEGLDAV